MFQYTDELNKLLSEGYAYTSPEVISLQTKYLATGNFAPTGKRPVYKRVAGSQEDQRELDYIAKRQAEQAAAQETINKYNGK